MVPLVVGGGMTCSDGRVLGISGKVEAGLLCFKVSKHGNVSTWRLWPDFLLHHLSVCSKELWSGGCDILLWLWHRSDEEPEGVRMAFSSFICHCDLVLMITD